MVAKRKSFISRLSKTGREYVDIYAAESQSLSMEEYWIKLWEEARPDESNASFLRSREYLQGKFPELTVEQVAVMIWLYNAMNQLDAAWARRAIRDDPAEMQLMQAHFRIAYAIRGEWGTANNFSWLLPMCGLGDMEFARRLGQGRRGGHSIWLSGGELIHAATISWLFRDFETVELIIAQAQSVPQKYFGKWEWPILLAFGAAVRGDATAVAVHISEYIQTIKKLRSKTSIHEVINLEAHGLYLLFEESDPKLVSEFDTEQEVGWDAEFHRWSMNRSGFFDEALLDSAPAPVADILNGNIPEWLPAFPQLCDVKLLEGDVGNTELVGIVDECLNWFRVYFPEPVFDFLPTTILFETKQSHAESICQRIEEAGGRAEVRPTQGKPFRPLAQT